MTYEDEQQPFSAADIVWRDKFAANPDSLIEAHKRLLEVTDDDRNELRSLHQKVKKLQAESSLLSAELQIAKGDVKRHRAALAGLRKSPSLRVGRAMLLPARALRGAARTIRSGETTLASEEKDLIAVGESSPVFGSDHRAQQRLMLQQYLLQAENDPTSGNLMRAISYAFFTLGDIREPTDLIHRYESTLEAVGAREKRTLEAVIGLERVEEIFTQIPKRQPNAGYLAERGRIMYCAHSTAHFNSNGYSTRTGELVQSMMGQGLDIVVAARPGYPWDVKVDRPKPAQQRFSKKIRGVEHVFNPGPSWTAQRMDQYWFEATDIYVREAQRIRASAIHAASNHMVGMPALIAARRLGIPFSYEVRGLWEVTEASAKPAWEESERYQLAKRLETFVAANADIVFAITDQVRDELVQRGVEPERIRLLPNGVDTDRFTPMPPSKRLRAQLNLPTGIPVVGYAGSLVHYEGLSDLLVSLAILKQEGTAFRAVIVGDGPELGALQAQTTQLGLDDWVNFVGRVEADTVPEYVSIFDIMPCPRVSLPVTELVSPLKPLEAMAAGKAMVLSDLAPLRTFAGKNQDRAILARPSSPEDLARAIRTLLENEELRNQTGQRARLWTVRERQWDAIGREVARVIRDTLDSAVSKAGNGRDLRGIRVGIIADTFTTEGMRPEVDLCELLPGTWRTEVAEKPLDVLIVESAWEGKAGRWHQKVGYYDDERFSDLRELVQFCNENSIPTIFWNKEDPVHFNRFRRTAQLFDHIFTTDAECISRYAVSLGARTRTVASLPFYAQPALHNPLPTEYPYSHTVAYAGSYYGARYPERSAELNDLLEAARPCGLTIYDRQHLNPESPYSFPPGVQQFVQGGLPYLEMVKAYKAHPVHINVNSVAKSPTMFSRRVVELAASGTAVLSGRGEGIDQVLAGLVPTVSNREEAEVLLTRWMDDEQTRLRDAWLAYRVIHRGHKAAHRLTMMLRTAGLVVAAPEVAAYAVRVPQITKEILQWLETQTVRPALVIVDSLPDSIESPLNIIVNGRITASQLTEQSIGWIATLEVAGTERTAFEDLLSATTFGDWSHIGQSVEDSANPGKGLVSYGPAPDDGPQLISVDRPQGTGAKQIIFRKAPILTEPTEDSIRNALPLRKPQRVLIAGHDLKFAGEIIKSLEADGHVVDIDRWAGHNQHDEAVSRSLLAKSDVVFCEWTLGNAAWYSKNLLPHQRLVTRFHSQELFTPYPETLNMSRISSVIFVGRHIMNIAVRDQGIAPDRAIVIPNPVDLGALELKKMDNARFTLGMVGVVPAQKHLDRALDLLARLRSEESRYQLRIKGKRPEDYPWMANRPEEMAYYQEQYRRIAEDPLLQGAVHFDGHGDDMPEWYQRVGVVLSLSDFESFHLTLADGAASGALVASLAWPGADQIYPEPWLSPSTDDLTAYIRRHTASIESWRKEGATAKSWAKERFDKDMVVPRIVDAILGDPES
ncbi:glycosyltransferase [Arthrobacter sp. Sa2BUA2]|uniref:D-inositol 3-phosphate glycosyltransferase n=1 Tax=Arthrobacter pullicola TaxID=2762224 RepID=A0ABR8YMF7_9MICC|nr:glycosyltransferase [Arthrobacter pullicola]MBD8045433.1 glycosyltransferase [Arthrobacter pullicola]